MTGSVSESVFESVIESALLAAVPSGGVVAESEGPYGLYRPGGYLRRSTKKYDRELCLLPQDVIDFIQATQPKEWAKLTVHHGAETREKFLKRLSQELDKRGALDVLRNEIKEAGCKFRLAHFRPSSGLNEELQKLHKANLFAVVRQLHFSESTEQSVDLAVFLNGIPIFTAELKNPMTGQSVTDAISQYRKDRDPREPLFKFRRCLAHFAVDPDLVYVTTQLQNEKTVFLPFNEGRDGGAGNPPVSPTSDKYPTTYLWDRVWARDSVLNLIQQFIHEVEEEDEKGRKTGKKRLIFPRFHQMDCVRRIIDHARGHGPGQRYLIQHSAGSGKSNSIAWLAHQLSVLHDERDERVFDSIIVITDRRILDRQLQRTVRQFEQTSGVVENIDTTSRKLKEALESGKTIIVTTLQKFPVIANEIGELAGKNFAVIVDEAHSSQSGESTKGLKKALSGSEAEALQEAADEEAKDKSPEEELEEKILAEIEQRGPMPNLSMFAFTATPKPKTLELFGTPCSDGSFESFSLYSMRQAIEEGFILDVLQNYSTYKVYFRLLKTISEDPRYDRKKAAYLLKSFVELHEHTIRKKVEIMVEHFHEHSAGRIGGKAKAMIVTRSRLHAVRYRLALDQYLKEKSYPYKALVAFSGTVRDGEADYTEAGMNGVPEKQTASAFEAEECRFLVVANKFQTGFDQPLLHTMYVDKKLAGVNAVQALSRLNRVHPDKEETMVLDFTNEADAIKEAFDPYYERTLLSEATDPNVLYDLQRRLLEFDIYSEADVDVFAAEYFGKKPTQAKLYKILRPCVDRFKEREEAEQGDFRSQLSEFIQFYAFLSQVLTFKDADLEKLYTFGRLLRPYIAGERQKLPVEVQQAIDMESLRIQPIRRGKIALDRGQGRLDPVDPASGGGPGLTEEEVLSRIIAELNERFGSDLGEADRVALAQVGKRLSENSALEASLRVNQPKDFRLAFEQKAIDVFQEIIDSNFQLYKRATDDPPFGKALLDGLFEDYLRRHKQAEDLIAEGESRTVEFKSTLRWSLREKKKDPTVVTHAVLKTIAAFLNTVGGHLLIGVADDGSLVGIAPDNFESEDKYLLHLARVVQNALGDSASTLIDPRIQVVNGVSVCLVRCDPSPETVDLKWKGTEKSPQGDVFVRSGPATIRLSPDDAVKYREVRTHGG